MKELKKTHIIKTLILVLVVIMFDLALEYVIYHVSRETHIFDDYLISGIIIQCTMMLLGVLLYLIFIHKRIGDNLFTKGSLLLTKKYVFKFLLIFPLVLILVYGMVYLFDSVTWSQLKQTVLPTNPPFWKIITFEMIFPGVGEEMLYRGFLLSLVMYPLMILGKALTKKHVMIGLVLVSIIFSVAHFGYRFSPFQIRFDSYQLMTAFILGIVEGYVFLKTKNLLGPILIHNISNLMLTAFPILIGLIF